MKIIFILIIQIMTVSENFPKNYCLFSSDDSLSYSDTVWSETAPVCLNFAEVRKMIFYPPQALKDSIEGRVVIKCLVDKNGSIEKTGIITGPEIFYPEVRRVAMFLKFTPGLVNNYPVKVWVTVPFSFRLK